MAPPLSTRGANSSKRSIAFGPRPTPSAPKRAKANASYRYFAYTLQHVVPSNAVVDDGKQVLRLRLRHNHYEILTEKAQTIENLEQGEQQFNVIEIPDAC